MTLRAALYSRYSSEMQRDTYTLDAQRRAMREAAQQRGYTIVHDLADEAMSARSSRIDTRPALVALMDAVDGGQVDVVMVHSLDRLSRNILTMLQLFKRMSDKGVTLVSLSENIDYTTPEGKLQLTMLGAFAAYFSDNLAKHSSKGKLERVRQGKHNNKPPFGYTVADDGTVAFDPTTVDIAREMWRLAASGMTDGQVAAALVPLGHVVSRGGVRSRVKNRFYLGDVRHGQTWHKGKHEPLIDNMTWDTVQNHRAAHRRTATNPHTPARVFSFTGLLTCPRCNHHYSVMFDHRNGRYTYYYCFGRRGYQCDQVLARDDTISGQFSDLLARLVIPDDELRETLEQQAEAKPKVNTDNIQRTMDRLRRLYSWGHLDEADYMRQYTECEAALQQVRSSIVKDEVRVALADLANLSNLWQDAGPADRNTIASTLFSDILVDQYSIVAVKPHEHWFPLLSLILQGHQRPGYLCV